jgi:hypothetical protein
MSLTIEWNRRIENWRQELPCRDGKIELEFRAFEVKTIRLRLSS